MQWERTQIKLPGQERDCHDDGDDGDDVDGDDDDDDDDGAVLYTHGSTRHKQCRLLSWKIHLNNYFI